MNLSKTYFYIVIVIFVALSIVVVTFNEDLKEKKYFIIYLKASAYISLVGVMMEMIGWNFLCKFNCILLSFSPLISVPTIKLIMLIYSRLFIKEAFHIQNRRLVDGYWIKNKGELDGNIFFYAIYSSITDLVPFAIITILFIAIEKVE